MGRDLGEGGDVLHRRVEAVLPDAGEGVQLDAGSHMNSLCSVIYFTKRNMEGGAAHFSRKLASPLWMYCFEDIL
ncbi:hypothetical protein GUJ93_ZPchr0009g425 [Zizania palustris]|uniref:Uncharacterized protein n=1 Tax=Zizania palustris TaxID=103762 RepID=A0A8J5RSM1_ZIZPA|nr:hypothetical protein GUJ93_ZPchr0009g425 [Zizania palustris]